MAMKPPSAAWLVVLAGCAPSTPPATVDTTHSKGHTCLVDASTAIPIPTEAPARIEVRHILVRHAELADPKGASRSKEAACLRALDALEALQSGALDWPEAVGKFSDTKEDDLGRVNPDDLNPAFAGAAFSLEVDQLSYVVETDRGYHVILRER